MPGERSRSGRWGRFAPEAALAMVATLATLGFLGSTELWGRREQRAAAEAVDTVDRGHWLVGQLQGRPRLEKPPLPRWVGAGLMLATGRRDEAIVRLPGALAALALVALAYAWGRSAGGRAVGLASGFALAATPSFLVEMRQAGVDGPLALCAGSALFAALRRWGAGFGSEEDDAPGSVGWARVFWVAVGLGFLCKGPAIALWAGVPVAGFLLARRRLGAGLRVLVDPWGLAACAGLVLAWPLAVAWHHPEAWGVWWLEVGQKTGGLGVEHGARGSILPGALGMTLPWAPLVVAALAGPPLRRWRGGDEADPGPPALGLAWWWAFGPLAVLGTWDVAKPSYYLPALPAAAVLAGAGWVGLCRRARDVARGTSARWALQVAWSGLFASAVVATVAGAKFDPAWAAPAALAGLVLGAAALGSARLWHLGRDAASLGALASGLVGVVLIGYGLVAPGENAARGHRALAGRLTRDLPPGATAWFLDDLDEGLWFYGPTLDLRPVPPLADAPQTNRGHALRTSAEAGRARAEVADARVRATVARLDAWADRAGPGAVLLVRGKLLDRLAADLPTRFAPVDREPGVRRNEVARLRVRAPDEVAALPTARR